VNVCPYCSTHTGAREGLFFSCLSDNSLVRPYTTTMTFPKMGEFHGKRGALARVYPHVGTIVMEPWEVCPYPLRQAQDTAILRGDIKS
jgi:hypothetical protein